MSEIAKSVGQRIRNYRTRQGLSQEKLAELSGCHPTYIGQLERGEKNMFGIGLKTKRGYRRFQRYPHSVYFLLYLSISSKMR